MYRASGLKRDQKLISNSISDFQECVKLNPEHFKAVRALSRLEDERMKLTSPRWWMERFGPTIIISFSVLIFLYAFFSVIIGRPEFERGIVLDNEKLQDISAVEMNMDIINSLDNTSFSSEKELLDKLKNEFGESFTDELGEIMLNSVKSEVIDWKFVQIDILTFASIAFGALIFMIAGAYLPQLTSLRLAGMQLEKSSSESRETSRDIGISR
jgi:hypothetical protein